jgi:DNA-binding CsgD family transcriptional regulator
LRSARDRFQVLHLSYWFLGSLQNAPDRMKWLSTYDESYTAVYMREYSPHGDRAFSVCFSRLLPLDWDEVRRSDASVERIHATAERFGVGRHGISIPIREPGYGDALFSINFNCADRDWSEVRRELANDLHLFAHYFHHRMRQVTELHESIGPMTLSPREREVLYWAAEGKTARETARLLRLSESAVKLYGAKAMDKLQARTKAHAVAIAVRHDMLG